MPINETNANKIAELETLSRRIEEMYVDDEPGAEREMDAAAAHIRKAIAAMGKL